VGEFQLVIASPMPERAPILICDDDDMIVQIVTSKLRSEGREVVTASNGASALQMIKASLPSALILDAVMPGIDGFDVLKLLRAHPRTAELPVLMLTARRSKDDVTKALNLGANGYLAKPFSLGELAARVERLLERTDTGQEAWL
jgi:DNA-binding response OmpR family regulator